MRIQHVGTPEALNDRRTAGVNIRLPSGSRSVANRTVFLACVTLMMTACETKQPPQATQPPTVQVVQVAERNVPIYKEWVATLDGDVNATIQARVSGYLLRQTYRDGSFVKQGQILFELDPGPYQALLEQSQAQLAQAEANLAKSKLDVERDTPLAKERAIAQQQLDNDVQSFKANTANVAAARANVQQAQLNVDYTQVRSLIDGVAGIAKGQVGDLVAPTTVLTTVSTLNPIRAYFGLGENEYLESAKLVYQAARGIDKNIGAKVLELILNDGTVYPYKGRLVSANRQIDASTGSIIVTGAFENPDGMLRPGQFAKVRAQVGIANNALLVPQRAVTELQGSYQVAVVGADDKVQIRAVEVGDRIGSDWIITKGLQSGERVIAEGVQKVREGAVVKPQLINAMQETP